MHLDNAKIKLNLNQSGDPVVIFVGEEAKFIKSDINKWGNTDEIQICFTDEIVETNSAAYQTDMQNLWDPLLAQQITQNTFGAIPSPNAKAQYSKLIMDDSKLVGAVAGAGLEALIGNNSEFSGAIMGKDVRTSQSKMHQDLSLKGARMMTGADWNLGGVHEVKM